MLFLLIVLLPPLIILPTTIHGDSFVNVSPGRVPHRLCNDSEPPIRSAICDRLQFRYFFDQPNQRCRLFVWGGCGNSLNNFDSELSCRRACNGSAPLEGDKDYIFPIIGASQKKIPTTTAETPPITEEAPRWWWTSKKTLQPPDNPLFTLPTCGLYRGPDFLLRGGETVDFPKEYFPWIAKLFANSMKTGDFVRNCTGTLIAPRWIISSASCAKIGEGEIAELVFAK